VLIRVSRWLWKKHRATLSISETEKTVLIAGRKFHLCHPKSSIGIHRAIVSASRIGNPKTKRSVIGLEYANESYVVIKLPHLFVIEFIGKIVHNGKRKEAITDLLDTRKGA
jgi:hypothetical protein